jgi:hypothetical protein
MSTTGAAPIKDSRKADSRLTVYIYLEHMDCPNASAWRYTTNESGWPRFGPTLHVRYDYESIYLKCEACGARIRHVMRHDTSEIESA